MKPTTRVSQLGSELLTIIERRSSSHCSGAEEPKAGKDRQSSRKCVLRSSLRTNFATGSFA